jgi:uncharacterized protein involved in exopolysaccharide biosynthesis
MSQSQLQNLGIAPRTALAPLPPNLGSAVEPALGEPPPDHPVSLSNVFGALSRRRKLVAAVFCTMLAAVVAVTLLAGDKYESEFKVLVKQRTEPIASSAEGAGFTRTPEVTEEETNTEVVLLKSRDLLAKVVALHHLDAPGTKPWSGWIEKLQGGSTPGERTDRAIRRLAANLRVDAVKKSNVIDVSYSSKNPVLSAGVLKTLSDLYMAKHVKLHETQGAYDFFAQQAEDSKAALAKAETDLTEFSHATSMAAPQMERDLMLQKMADIRVLEAQSEAAADSAFERYKTLQTELAATPPRMMTQVKSADNAMLMGQLKSTLLNLELKRTELAVKFAPNYPAVKEVDDQIAQTKAAIDAENAKPLTDNSTDQNPTYQWISGELAKVQAEMPALRTQVKMAQQNEASTERRVMKLNDASTIKETLLRNVQTAEQNYTLYQQKRELARISDELDKRRISNVVLAEEPVPSTLPVRSRAVTIAMGFLLCLVIGGAAGFAADYLDPTFRTWREVEDYLNVPVLAVVPESAGGTASPVIAPPKIGLQLELEAGAGTVGA